MPDDVVASTIISRITGSMWTGLTRRSSSAIWPTFSWIPPMTSSIAAMFCGSSSVCPSGAANSRKIVCSSTGFGSSGNFRSIIRDACSDGMPGMENLSLKPFCNVPASPPTMASNRTHATITIHLCRYDHLPRLNRTLAIAQLPLHSRLQDAPAAAVGETVANATNPGYVPGLEKHPVGPLSATLPRFHHAPHRPHRSRRSPHQRKEKSPSRNRGRGISWRWRRDLNPRLGVTQQSLSRRSPSAARTRHR